MCYKTWNDIIISLPKKTVSWCCKTDLTAQQTKETTFDLETLNTNGLDFLFNHPILQKRKNDLATGVRCPDCHVCWESEDRSSQSHRTLYTKTYESKESFTSEFDYDTPATFIELELTNKCNLACVYCGPELSSRWQKELKQRHPDTEDEIFHKVMELFTEYCNTKLTNEPYINISLLGGEPFFTDHMYIFLEYLSKFHIKPEQEVTVTITTGMAFPEKKFTKFIELIERTPNIIYIMQLSGEAIDERAELIRWGMDFKTWNNNLDMFLTESARLKNLVIGFGCAHNALSLPYFKDFLVYINNKLEEHDYKSDIWFLINYIEDPQHLSISMLDTHHADSVTEQIEYMENEMTNLYKKYEYITMLKSLRNQILNANVTPEMKQNASEQFKMLEDRRKVSYKSQFPHFDEIIK
tara:strand:- start:779 stop:2011 length:1233 start_codon:yes stop_codon:yes gene_type:complete